MKLILSLLLLLSFSQTAHGRKNHIFTAFEWEAVPGVKSYGLRLTHQKTKKRWKFKVKKAKWEGAVPPGLYDLQIRSIDSRGVPGQWSEPIDFWVKLAKVKMTKPLPKGRVYSKKELNAEVIFQWDKVVGASYYLIKIRKKGEGTRIREKVYKRRVKFELPVGQKYQWQVTAFDRERNSGHRSKKWNSFTLIGKRIESVIVEPPPNEFVRVISWSKPNLSRGFRVILKKKNGEGKWETVTKKQRYGKTSFEIPEKYPGGEYRIKVWALGVRRKSSLPTLFTFQVRDGDRSREAEMAFFAKKALEKPEGHYAIAEFEMGEYGYDIRNLQDNPQTNRIFLRDYRHHLEVGYGLLKSNQFGFQGVIGADGYFQGEKYYGFYNGALSLIYTMGVSKKGRLYAYLGAKYMEVPIFRATDAPQYVGIIGTHLDVEYMHGFSSTWGMNLQGKVFYGLKGGYTPGDSKREAFSQESQFGGSAYYRPTLDIVIHLGARTSFHRLSYRALSDATTFAPEGAWNALTLYHSSLFTRLEIGF